MKTIKGPALFLGAVRRRRGAVQLAGTPSPNGRPTAAMSGVQIPTWASAADRPRARRRRPRTTATSSRAWRAPTASRSPSSRPTCRASSSPCTRPTTTLFDGFAAPEVRGNPKARQEWAVEQVKHGAARLEAPRPQGAWPPSPARSPGPSSIPWPQRPAGLVETAFDELARRWKPILDHADESGVDLCYEIHPGEDLHDGVTFEMFLERRRRPSARQHALRPVALRAAVPRLPRLHRHLPRAASRCSTSRTPSSIRPAGRASMAAIAPGSTAPAASARSATARSISARSSRS